MRMETLQIRLSREQLSFIDQKVKEGRYPSRSEAIRDYLRKAQLWEALERILELGHSEESEEELSARLEQIREKVYREKYAPRTKK